jgi:hypothetical protein
VMLVVAGCGERHVVTRDGEVAGPECPSYMFICSGKCAMPGNDNCGGCGIKCDTAAGFTCKAGKCACFGALSDCGGVCVDTGTDSNNCGGCNRRCDKGEKCVKTGGMICIASECFPSTACRISAPGCLKRCNGKCVDLDSDNDHCGACGNTCNGGKTCAAGKCTCPTMLPDECSGTCTDLKVDKNNCGKCGCPCPATAPACGVGKCLLVCPTGQTGCGTTTNPNPNCPAIPSVCVTLTNDPNNCGACGTACTGGKKCVSSWCS